MSISLTYLNGRPATAEDLAPLAFAGYAHFTAMQVRGGAVRGLDLHLSRLRTASDELFGKRVSDVQIREQLRVALDAAPPDVSVTCYLSARPGEFMPSGPDLSLDVLIKVTDPVTAPTGPLALDVVRHQRHLPQVKHVGEVSKTLYLRRAHARGFDDAAFEDDAGRLSEATIWNLAFWDGSSVIWPDADVLPGVTMQILARQLEARGIAQAARAVRLSQLNDQMSAVVMNSWTPAVPIARFGEHRLRTDSHFTQLLREAYDAEVPVPLSS
ncbi:MAG: aminotransferase class IV family protein [Nocardioides sp.]